VTLHEFSAAYVAAAQAPVTQPKPSSTYEPHCLERWSWSVSAMDETISATQEEGQKWTLKTAKTCLPE